MLMLLRIRKPAPNLVIAAFDEYAIKAFELNAVDYLLKPFSKDRFEKAIQKYLQQQNNTSSVEKVLETAAESPLQQNRIVVKDGTRIKIIPVQQVHYLEAADDYVKIVSNDGNFLKKRTMYFFENSLAPFQFVRVHRSYIVNTQLITRIEPYEKDSYQLLLTTGEKIPVSKSGYSKLKEVLGI